MPIFKTLGTKVTKFRNGADRSVLLDRYVGPKLDADKYMLLKFDSPEPFSYYAIASSR
jgi:hypothetical protein